MSKIAQSHDSPPTRAAMESRKAADSEDFFFETMNNTSNEDGAQPSVSTRNALSKESSVKVAGEVLRIPTVKHISTDSSFRDEIGNALAAIQKTKSTLTTNLQTRIKKT